LDAPRTEKDSHSYISRNGLQVGASGMQGWRLEMEDAHVLIDIPSRPDHLFLAVFDGHAGSGGAIYASRNIVSVLEGTSQWEQYLKSGATDAALLGQALTQAFIVIDANMRIHQGETFGQDTSGCTAVSAIVAPNFIICANAGDSRCVLGTNGEAKPLSDDHKPYNDTERRRVEAAGGFVQYNRVDGDLAVSRALGDFGYKNRPDLPAEEQKVDIFYYILLYMHLVATIPSHFRHLRITRLRFSVGRFPAVLTLLFTNAPHRTKF
jgi:serine/threonine protein phosphatase PrpC